MCNEASSRTASTSAGAAETKCSACAAASTTWPDNASTEIFNALAGAWSNDEANLPYALRLNRDYYGRYGAQALAEIRRAFQARITRFEEFKIVCYAAA